MTTYQMYRAAYTAIRPGDHKNNVQKSSVLDVVWSVVVVLAALVSAQYTKISGRLMELAGLGSLIGAAWWYRPIVGLVATGVVLLILSHLSKGE